jgi:hypothetical protein
MAWLRRRAGNTSISISAVRRTYAMPPAIATQSNAIDDSSRHTISMGCHIGTIKRPDSMLPSMEYAEARQGKTCLPRERLHD